MNNNDYLVTELSATLEEQSLLFLRAVAGKEVLLVVERTVEVDWDGRATEFALAMQVCVCIAIRWADLGEEEAVCHEAVRCTVEPSVIRIELRLVASPTPSVPIVIPLYLSSVCYRAA